MTAGSDTTLDAAVDPLLGQTLDGRYRVDAQIGEGGMGAVYRAHQINVDRPVALKVLRVDRAAREESARRFEIEARIVSRLRHPNTLKLIDFGRLESGGLYVVTELLEGTPLDRLLTKGPLAPPRACELMAQVCDALAEAHAAGIIHRDLKPGNVFVERPADREVAKVLDFGIAKVLDHSTVTEEGRTLGTPAYMAPEQITGGEIDGRTDLYALGIMLFECLTGARPFQSDSAYGLMMMHVRDEVPSLSRLLPPGRGVEGLAALGDALLAKEPSARPPDAATVRDHLRALAGELRGAPAGILPSATPTADLQAATALSGGTAATVAPPGAAAAVAAPGGAGTAGRAPWIGVGVVGGLAAVGVAAWLAFAPRTHSESPRPGRAIGEAAAVPEPADRHAASGAPLTADAGVAARPATDSAVNPPPTPERRQPRGRIRLD